MASWSDWFAEANRIGFELKEVLPINLPNDLDRLYSSGLPVFERRFLDGSNFSLDQVVEFCNRHPINWVRVYHKKELGKRKSILQANTRKVISFLENIGVDLKEYNIQLYESKVNKFGGNIISDKDRVIVEIAEGTQDNVGKCLTPFFHGIISETGVLKFRELNADRAVIRAAANSLKYLKLARGEYLPGYFEFMVSDKGKTYFLDYKTIFSNKP
ncbi:MAG: hypothetical protein WCK29_01815 [archaeon]